MSVCGPACGILWAPKGMEVCGDPICKLFSGCFAVMSPPPPTHAQLVAKRPLSPDVMEIDHKQLHYKMPPGAISSITNRATGVMLSLGEHCPLWSFLGWRKSW